MLLFSMIAVASASDVYDDALVDEGYMPCTPSCVICHLGAAGGAGTAQRDFALALQERGLVGGANVGALRKAMEQLQLDVIDSNDDGQSDIDALAEGIDPNTGEATCDALAPVYGCLSHSGAAPTGWLALLGLLFVRRPGRPCARARTNAP